MKLNWFQAIKPNPTQPPSGGCVLKPIVVGILAYLGYPAAFGRLCVETAAPPCVPCYHRPAAFGRLCVETKAFRKFTV